jgi:hypothetical protein
VPQPACGIQNTRAAEEADGVRCSQAVTAR